MLNNIQALRFYAAFAVVLYHSRKLFMELGLQGDTFLYWAKFGNFGVDVFFVISGYVMWYTTREAGRDAGTALDFLRRRLFRIYLGYWPFYILAAAVTLLIGERDPGNIYWLESFFLLNPTIRHQVLGVAWTLSYELYFYLMFTVLILLPLARARQALVVLCLVVVVLNLLQPTHTFEYGFFISPFLGGKPLQVVTAALPGDGGGDGRLGGHLAKIPHEPDPGFRCCRNFHRTGGGCGGKRADLRGVQVLGLSR
jgi:peptidoglycan/LPS O-acetylase OafA/YrhL